jgi:CHAT domain-containing protein
MLSRYYRQSIFLLLFYVSAAGNSQQDLVDLLLEARTDQVRTDLITKNYKSRADAINNLLERADQSFRNRDYPTALKVYELCLLLSSDEVKSLLPRIHHGLGKSHNISGNYPEALSHFLKSSSLAEATGEIKGLPNTFIGIGNIYLHRGELSEALRYFSLSAKFSRELNDKRWLLNASKNMGVVLRRMGKYPEALNHYQSSLSLARELGDELSVSGITNNIAILHFSTGDYVRSLEYYEQSLKLKQKLDDISGQSNVLLGIGYLHSVQGNYRLAKDFYMRSLELAEKINDTALIARALKNCGLISSITNDYRTALDYYNKSITYARRSGDKVILAMALNNMGFSYYLMGDLPNAIKYTEESVAIKENLSDESNLAISLNNLGSFYGMAEKYEKGIELAHRAAAIGHKLGVPDLVWQSESTLGEICQRWGKNSEAEKHFESAIETVEGLRTRVAGTEEDQQRFFENKISPYYSLFTLLAGQNRREDALRLAERARGRVLLDVLQRGRLSRTRTTPFSMTQLETILDSQTAVLEFMVNDQSTTLILIDKDTKLNLNLFNVTIKREELKRLVAEFRDQLATKDLLFKKNARKLYDLLLGPVSEKLKDKRSLIVAPDGLLWDLPFQALQSEQSYLLDQCSITYTPSISVLHEMVNLSRKRVESKPTLLAFGNPTMGGGTRLEKLPEAEREVKTISTLFGSEVFTGASAMEERAKALMGRHNILHFATHGILDDKDPMSSYLLLSPSPDRSSDGMLEAREVLNLRLKADLAILSACETARGRVGAGEGIIGLSWAFFVAGCPRTVVSQWKVETSSTTELMIAFHKEIKRNYETASQYRVAESLRKAALEIKQRKEYQHPFYWAGFISMGNGQ